MKRHVSHTGDQSWPGSSLIPTSITHAQSSVYDLDQKGQVRSGQIGDIDPMWVYVCSSVTDSGPKLKQYWVNFSRLLMKSSLSITRVSIVGSLRDREVACSVSDRQGSNFESCVWRTVSSQSSHHPQEVLLAQFSLYVHKGGLKPDSFHFCLSPEIEESYRSSVC